MRSVRTAYPISGTQVPKDVCPRRNFYERRVDSDSSGLVNMGTSVCNGFAACASLSRSVLLSSLEPATQVPKFSNF